MNLQSERQQYDQRHRNSHVVTSGRKLARYLCSWKWTISQTRSVPFVPINQELPGIRSQTSSSVCVFLLIDMGGETKMIRSPWILMRRTKSVPTKFCREEISTWWITLSPVSVYLPA